MDVGIVGIQPALLYPVESMLRLLKLLHLRLHDNINAPCVIGPRRANHMYVFRGSLISSRFKLRSTSATPKAAPFCVYALPAAAAFKISIPLQGQIACTQPGLRLEQSAQANSVWPRNCLRKFVAGCPGLISRYVGRNHGLHSFSRVLALLGRSLNS